MGYVQPAPRRKPVFFIQNLMSNILDNWIIWFCQTQLQLYNVEIYCYDVALSTLELWTKIKNTKLDPKNDVVVSFCLSTNTSRSKLQRHGQSEEQLLACSRSEEPLLDKLPCLYHSVASDSWCDQASLLTSLRTIIWEEQKKIVWVEPDLWWKAK